MARFISINEILHKGRFAEKVSESSIITDALFKEDANPVNVIETPTDIEPTIQDAPVADTVEVITDTNTEEANVNEADSVTETNSVTETDPAVEEAAPKKKGGKKTKTTEENN